MAQQLVNDEGLHTSPDSHKSAFKIQKTEVIASIPNLDLNIWYNNLLKSEDVSFPRSNQLGLSPAIKAMHNLLMRNIEQNNDIGAFLIADPPALNVLPFFKRLLKSYISQRNCNSKLLLRNESFLSSLLALSLQIYLFVKAETSIDFEMILSCLNVSILDYWKQLNYFLDQNKNIPVSLKWQLKGTDLKILTETAWKRDSYIYKTIYKSFNSSNNRNKSSFCYLQLFGFTQFFGRLVYHSALRIRQVSSFIGLDDKIQEEVWAFLKFFLSECTEYLRDKSVETVILCCMFLAFRMRCEVRLHTLVEKYKEATGLTVLVSSDKDEIDEINKFYSKEFCLIIKLNYYMGRENNRIKSLHPDCNLKDFLKDLKSSEGKLPIKRTREDGRLSTSRSKKIKQLSI